MARLIFGKPTNDFANTTVRQQCQHGTSIKTIGEIGNVWDKGNAGDDGSSSGTKA